MLQTRLRASSEALSAASDPSYASICDLHDQEPITE